MTQNESCDICQLVVGSEQKLYFFCVMIPHRTSPTCMTITKHPSVKYNQVILPGISHVAHESFIAENNLVETTQ